MIVDSITMENFGPYLGSHDLRLGLGDRPLVVIHGQNMAGKTMIINAVRWALYGIAKDRLGEPIPACEILNREAFKAGDKRVAVTLRLVTAESGKDTTYTLRRQQQIKSERARGEEDRDYDTHLTIERDGRVLPAAQFDAVVTSLLPEPISRFFLFDGELLKEYEELVRAGGERGARAVKEAIEMILGLPAARYGRDDVKALRAETDRRVRREGGRDQRARTASERLNDLDATERQLKVDRDEAERELRRNQQETFRFEEALKRYEETREDAGRLEALTALQLEIAEETADKHNELRVLVTDLWRDVLTPRIAAETTRLDDERRKRSRAASLLDEARRDVDRLRRSLDTKECSQCGQNLPGDAVARARAELATAEMHVAELEPEAHYARIEELTRVIDQLRSVAPAGKTDAVRLASADLDKLRLKEYRNSRELDDISERISGSDSARVLEYDLGKRQHEKLVAELSAELGRLDARLQEIATEARQQQDIVLQNQSPVFARLKKEVGVLADLEAVFTEAVDRLADELRMEVERVASEIFLSLTTDKTYAGLKINENYGLVILREDGSEVGQRSAGAEQVVALALLGALNRLATKRGPVIMDTPFGRLDRNHRQNILRFLPTMADQVVLLVHDGEIDRQRDLASIEGQISAQFAIDHRSSTSSSLVPEGVTDHG